MKIQLDIADTDPINDLQQKMGLHSTKDLLNHALTLL
jgi:hypothetical protein